MNIWLQCSDPASVSDSNPMGFNYGIQHGYGTIIDKLKDHVNGRRFAFHLPFGRPEAGKPMPFDAHYLMLSKHKAAAQWYFKSFQDEVSVLFDHGATEVIAYLGSLPACNRINSTFGKPGRMDDIDRMLWQITRLPKECGCSLAFDATATVWEDWHFYWLKLQQAELAKWGRHVYVEATPFCTPYKSNGDYENPNMPADKLVSVVIDSVGWPFVANRTYNEFPYFVTESTFTKRHVTGVHKCFPLLGSPEWYETEVNVLSHSKDHESRTVPEVREWVEERTKQGVVPWVNVGVLQRLEP